MGGFLRKIRNGEQPAEVFMAMMVIKDELVFTTRNGFVREMDCLDYSCFSLCLYLLGQLFKFQALRGL